MFAEVIFPLKIKPLTYKVPTFSPSDLVGRIVKAPLGNRILYGIVSDIRDSLDNEDNITNKKDAHKKLNIKEIISFHQHFGSSSTLDFLKWLSEYYLTPPGVALSSCFFKETVNFLDKPLDSEPFYNHNKTEIYQIYNDVSAIAKAIQSLTFKTFLLHCPSHSYEKIFLNDLFRTVSSFISGAVVLVPEISWIETISEILKAIFSSRVCVIHSKQRKKERTDTIKGILSNKYDIIVGTRSAILMPLKKLSLIAVVNEHSLSYKGEEGLRYNGRDVAIRRGFFEKVPVLLSSICPSVESFYNSKTKKYYSLAIHQGNSKSLNLFSPKARPSIEIVSIWDAYRYNLSISKKVIDEVKKYLSAKEGILFIVNKKGHSHIVCKECGYIFRCFTCKTPLILYKSDGSLRCDRCRYNRKIPDTCEVCNGIELRQLGLGIERVKSDIERLLQKDAIELNKNNRLLSEQGEFLPLLVGHSYQIRSIDKNIFKAAVFCDIDLSFFTPDYKANERTFQIIMDIAQIVKPNGRIYLQTKDTKNKILNYIKNYNFNGFYNHELLIRQETGLPPFKRLILFNIFLKQKDNFAKQEVNQIFLVNKANEVDILGPIEDRPHIKSGQNSLQFILRSKDRKMLQQVGYKIKEKLEELKGIKVATDVDPIRF